MHALLAAALGAILAGPTEAPAFHDPVWSPDGSQIAFYSNADGDFDVYLYSLNSRSVVRLTDDPGHDGNPAWAPDGSRLSFTSNRDGDAEIYLMAQTGMLLDQLTRNDAPDQAHSWSSSGRAIYFEGRRADNDDIWRLDLLSGSITRLTEDPARDFRPVECLGRVWFQSNRSGRYRLHTMNPDGSDVRIVGEDDGHQHAGPACGPLSGRIAHYRQDEEGRTSLWIMNGDGTAARALTDGSAGNDTAPNWSPDERWIVFGSDRSGNPSLLVIPSEGGDAVPLTAFERD